MGNSLIMTEYPLFHGLNHSEIWCDVITIFMKRFLLEIICVLYGFLKFSSAVVEVCAYGAPQIVVATFVYFTFSLMKLIMRFRKVVTGGEDTNENSSSSFESDEFVSPEELSSNDIYEKVVDHRNS